MVADLETSDSETLGGSVDDLRAFCAVIELGSISAASRQLATTKGGLSRRVSRLERRLGAKLLARTPRAVSPTEEGTAFYGKIRDALVLLDEAADGARQSQSIPRGHLRVTAPHDLGVEVLPPLIVEFHRLHPQITLELLLSDTRLDLATQRIDLALRATQDQLPDMGYRASAIIEFPVAFYASTDYLKAHDTPDSPAALAGHLLVLLRTSGGPARLTVRNQRGRKETLALRPVIQTDNFAGVSRLLQNGGGIGAVPEIIAAPAVQAGRLVRVLPDWTLARARLHAISIAGLQAPARVRVFREFIRDKLTASCPP